MPLNVEVLKDRIGALKILSIIIGIITIGFIGHSYYRESKDEAYLACVIVCFIISFIWSLLIVVDVLSAESSLLKKIDMVYHLIAFVFYVITLILFFVSLIGHSTGTDRITFRLWQRVFALIFGALNGGIYGLITLLFYQSMG